MFNKCLSLFPVIFMMFTFATKKNEHLLNNKKYNIADNRSFNTDSIQSYNNQFVHLGVLNSIKISTAILEIRIYSETSKVSGRINVIKLYTDSLLVDNYYYTNIPYLSDNVFNYTSDQLEEARKKSRKNVFYKKMRYPDDTQKIMYNIIGTNIFTISDQKNLLDSLNRKQVKVNDPCYGIVDCYSEGTQLFEIKYMNQFRNFRLLAADYYKKNNTMRVFKPKFDISRILHPYIKNT